MCRVRFKPEKEPTKYWLSNLPASISLRKLVATAKLRWRIERDYEELKQDLGIETPTQPKSMPRSTSRACARWLTHGRSGVHSEPAGTGLEGLHQHPPQPGIPTPAIRELITEFCCISPSPRHLAHHHKTGASLGHSAHCG